ncbi:hypothetical protein [Streptomyces sp. CA-106131]|uniref:hypothetical protein n=1 Tax=Streptomyces sp. CA-106131 TaxID=3240045 RepID=UPI003D911199
MEFYRPRPVDANNNPIPDVDALLKQAGAGTKAENGILSTAVGMTASYTPQVLSNTRKNEERDEKLRKLRQELEQAKADVTNPAKAGFKKQAAKRATARQEEINKLSATGPLYPAMGDAVKALNAAIARGDVAWRLVTFKTPA